MMNTGPAFSVVCFVVTCSYSFHTKHNIVNISAPIMVYSVFKLVYCLSFICMHLPNNKHIGHTV
uniref:Uncharacterized protein n=1 Tax=Ciona intestinalis TaxID=7719 RepID=H2XWM8_CIOIN